MFPKKSFCFGALAAAIVAAPAASATLSVESLLGTYNAVTSGDFRSNQEVEGRLYVGGNLTGNAVQTGLRTLPAGPAQNVVVKGNATIGKISGNGQIVIGGNATSNIENQSGQGGSAPLDVFVGGAYTGNYNANPGTSTAIDVQDGLAGDAGFEARFPEVDYQAVRDYSRYLSTLTGSDFAFSDANNRRITATGNAVANEGNDWDASNVSVYHATLDDFVNGGYALDFGSDQTIIMNVAGTSGTFSANPLGGTFGAENILWNFYEATGTINVNSVIAGSVLAPWADLRGFNGSTEGSVFAQSITLDNGELHLRPFEGDLPEISAVPVPASLPLLLAGLGGLWISRRRMGAA